MIVLIEHATGIESDLGEDDSVFTRASSFAQVDDDALEVAKQNGIEYSYSDRGTPVFNADDLSALMAATDDVR
jgi:hypothetical protein